MCESPNTLQHLCISFIAKNVNIVFNEIIDDHGNVVRYSFKTSVCLPCIISERLFFALNENVFSDQLLCIFEPTLTYLQRVHIKDASNISTRGLRVLRSHMITELEVIGLSRITVNDLIGCLGDWTLENLQLLNVSNSTFVSSERVRVVIALSKLRNLKYLDVSFTEFNSQALEIVAEDLPSLESLNISGTVVTDISPLRKCKERLKYLDMYNLRIAHTNKYIAVLSELHNLLHLDISDDKEDPYEICVPNNCLFSDFLKKPHCLPKLVSFDISGKTVDDETLLTFLKNHLQLRFLGLFGTDHCIADFLCNPVDHGLKQDLIVTGHANEAQVLESLRRYKQRKIYLQKSLYHLYSFIQSLSDARLDIIELVLQSMKTSPHVLGIQTAATACLYNLTKGELSLRIHTNWLKQVVELTLVAMQNFPTQPQLLKNSLLTLCSDRIMQDVSFNRYHCAELVMNALITFDDPAMNRMSVAICSILAARISTAEATNLGAKETYMKRLLNIVRVKTDLRDIDVMLKFTLSALWNLTDDSPKTCSVFLNLGGMELFLKVLQRFPGESLIETKILGLLNNIAEVSYLRPQLMKEEFIIAVKSLLHSEHIDSSYFAAGILAHIASEGKKFWTYWTLESISWEDMVYELGSVVSGWQIPEMEMVAYRSFHPFYPLFSCYKTYQVQLWAAWAIHHVCSKNPKRYCPMIVEEGGVQILQHLVENPEVHASVAEISRDILHIVEDELP